MDKLQDLLSPINIIFIGVIIYLTIEDLRSFQSRSYRNYKAIIFSVGILGTFTGIFWGLLNFESKDLLSIQNSIPSLLSGLKTAFITSIVGMIAALTLTFAQKKFFDTSYSEDSSDILRSIEIKLSRLEDIHGLYDTNLELLREVNSIKDDIYDVNKDMLDTLTTNFERTNESLENAINRLSEDSSKEITEALNKIVSNFNTNMIEQFGQNFHELNDAVSKLAAWQDKYKQTLVQMNDNLVKAVNSIEATESSLGNIADRNDKIMKTYEMFGEIMKQSEDQAYQINTKILAQVELLEVIQSVFDDTRNKFAHFVNEFSTGSNKVMTGFIETKDSLDKLSDRISSSLEQQATNLQQLSGTLEEELPKSLGMLDKSLTSLTEGFKNDYKTLLEYYKQLMVSRE